MGWHPNCRCYTIPIVKGEARYWEDEDKQSVDNDEITEMPENFKKWASQNQDRIARAEQRGTLPYFVRDNRERVKQAVKQGDVLMAKEGHKTGFIIINGDKKLSSAVHSALDKQVLATLSDAQKENASKVAEKLKIQLGKPMTFKDLDDDNVNPKLNQSKAFENNCSLSVYAGEARARGLDVEALRVMLPKKGKPSIAYQLGEDMSMGWINPVIGKSPIVTKYAITSGQHKQVLDEIYSNIAESGRYYIGFDVAKANHALSAYRVKGKLYIYDQQINSSYDLLTLLKEAEATSMEVLRLDNLLFDATYIDHWIKARNIIIK